MQHPRDIRPVHIVRRTSGHQVKLLANELGFIAPGALLEAIAGRAAWPGAVFSLYWPLARADSFAPVVPGVAAPAPSAVPVMPATAETSPVA